MILSLYRVITTLGAPAISGYLHYRKAQGKEDSERFTERLGFAGVLRPSGAVIWIHAASVGESLSMLSLIDRLIDQWPNLRILLTTGTVTSAHLMAERLSGDVIHQYVPVDRLAYVRRFIDHWRPNLVLWAESEFWPNLITEVSDRNIPLILINGRISPRSFEGWQNLRSLIRQILKRFTLCLGQTEEDAERLRHLGAPSAKCVGNLKFASPPLPADSENLAELETALSGRTCWLAASTHPGEEEIIWGSHEENATKFECLLTIIVPRHSNRGAEIAERLTALGAKVARRSTGELIDKDTQVYIADTMGELGLFFRLCDVVFMGKSLVPLGGQNLLEPARLGCAILHGKHMANFDKIAARMNDAGAVQLTPDGDALTATVARLLSNDKLRATLSERARDFAEAEAGVLDNVVTELTGYLNAIHERN